MQPDQIDMMSESELRSELRLLVNKNIEMKCLIIDIQATLRAIYNSSSSMMQQLDAERKRLGI